MNLKTQDRKPEPRGATGEDKRAANSQIVAWTVEIKSMTCVVFAATKPKAQWIATKAYWEAYGRRKGEWTRAVAWRAKPYDQSRLRFEPPKAWCEDYVMDTIQVTPRREQEGKP